MRISSTPYFDYPSFQKFKYNGKELDMMSGLNSYDYGARQYYSVVPGWDRVDPLCEKYYHISPYAYCANNPVNAIDPDGRDAWILVWATQSSDDSGNRRLGHTAVVVENFNSSGVKNFDYSALERYMSKHDMSQLSGMLQNNFSENSQEGYGEGYAPDGIIRLGLNGEESSKLQQEYKSLIMQGSPYNGESNNCTTFVANGINNSGVGSVNKETIIDWRGFFVYRNPIHQSFTPNNTYNQLKCYPN